MWLSSLEIGAALLRPVTEIALKSPFFICVNRSPTRWYTMNTWMYCAEITVLVCEQKPYPVWFSCWCKSYPVKHWLWDMLACGQALHFLRAKRAARERASERRRLSLLSRAAQAWLLASFSNQESLPAGWGHVRELSQVLLVRLFNEPYCKKIKSCSFGEPARRSQTK